MIGDDTRVARLTVEKAWGPAGSTTVTIVAAEYGVELEGIGSRNEIAGWIIKEAIE